MKELFPGYKILSQGLHGRSAGNIVAISINDANDLDAKHVARHFPNVSILTLSGENLTGDGLHAISSLQHIDWLSLKGATIRDDDLAVLKNLQSLTTLNLRETLITDQAVPHLVNIYDLRILDCLNTDVSEEALTELWEWRGFNGEHYGYRDLKLIAAQAKSELHARIVWADGQRTRGFPGHAEIQVYGPLSEQLNKMEMRIHRVKNPLSGVGWYAYSFKDYPDGDYRFGLKLGHHEAETVTIPIRDGRCLVHEFEFRMPVTKRVALGVAAPEYLYLRARIRWPDGRLTSDFPGSAIASISGPFPAVSGITMQRYHNQSNPLSQLQWTDYEYKNFPDGDYQFSLKLGDTHAKPVNIHFTGGKPSKHQFEFQMPVKKKQALEESSG